MMAAIKSVEADVLRITSALNGVTRTNQMRMLRTNQRARNFKN